MNHDLKYPLPPIMIKWILKIFKCNNLFQSFIDTFHLFILLFSFSSNNHRAVSDRAVIKPPTYFYTIIIKANDKKEDMNHYFLSSNEYFSLSSNLRIINSFAFDRVIELNS